MGITRDDIKNFERKELKKIAKAKRKELSTIIALRKKKISDLKRNNSRVDAEILIDFYKVLVNHEELEVQLKNIKRLEFFLKPTSASSNKWRERVEKARKTPILDYVSQYTEIRKRGRSYWCKSLLSEEKTPSMSIDAENNIWYCFSTSQGGDLIDLVKKHRGMTFKEVVHLLS